MGKRFFVTICVVLCVLAGCGSPAPREGSPAPREGRVIPDSQAAATPGSTPFGSAATATTLATASLAPRTEAPTLAPATSAPATQAPATQAPVTQAPATRAPATAAPTAKPISIVFTAVRSPVSPNGTGLASVSTAPNISCDIVVTYKSGASKAQGLTAKTSDAAGVVTWTWNIGPSTTLGTWPIDVTCGSARGHATFVVQ